MFVFSLWKVEAPEFVELQVRSGSDELVSQRRLIFFLASLCAGSCAGMLFYCCSDWELVSLIVLQCAGATKLVHSLLLGTDHLTLGIMLILQERS